MAELGAVFITNAPGRITPPGGRPFSTLSGRLRYASGKSATCLCLPAYSPVDAIRGLALSCPPGRAGVSRGMKKSELTKPTRVERAKSRLDKAVLRLEEVLGTIDARLESAGKEEISEIARDMRSALRDRDALKAANRDMATRLDGAITRIRAVLGA